MNRRQIALLCAFGATTIYGLNHIIAKDVMPSLSPLALVIVRVAGASILFWIVSFIIPHQRISKRDFIKIAFCGVLAVMNMFFFLKGLRLSTPINSSLIITIIPVIVLLLSVIFLKERVTIFKILGIALAMIGAVTLILFSANHQINAPNIPLGNFFLLLNAIFFSLYLVLIKQILQRYHPLIIMRWVFLFGFLTLLPFSYTEISSVAWQSLPSSIILGVSYVVIGTTFLTFTLNMVALKHLKASTLSVFTYLQPLQAILLAFLLGKDHMNTMRIIAAALVFIGVWMTSHRIKKKS